MRANMKVITVKSGEKWQKWHRQFVEFPPGNSVLRGRKTSIPPRYVEFPPGHQILKSVPSGDAFRPFLSRRSWHREGFQGCVMSGKKYHAQLRLELRP